MIIMLNVEVISKDKKHIPYRYINTMEQRKSEGELDFNNLLDIEVHSIRNQYKKTRNFAGILNSLYLEENEDIYLKEDGSWDILRIILDCNLNPENCNYEELNNCIMAMADKGVIDESIAYDFITMPIHPIIQATNNFKNNFNFISHLDEQINLMKSVEFSENLNAFERLKKIFIT